MRTGLRRLRRSEIDGTVVRYDMILLSLRRLGANIGAFIPVPNESMGTKYPTPRCHIEQSNCFTTLATRKGHDVEWHPTARFRHLIKMKQNRRVLVIYHFRHKGAVTRNVTGYPRPE
jgi:hypothetical protein